MGLFGQIFQTTHRDIESVNITEGDIKNNKLLFDNFNNNSFKENLLHSNIKYNKDFLTISHSSGDDLIKRVPFVREFDYGVREYIDSRGILIQVSSEGEKAVIQLFNFRTKEITMVIHLHLSRKI